MVFLVALGVTLEFPLLFSLLPLALASSSSSELEMMAFCSFALLHLLTGESSPEAEVVEAVESGGVFFLGLLFLAALETPTAALAKKDVMLRWDMTDG